MELNRTTIFTYSKFGRQRLYLDYLQTAKINLMLLESLP